MADSGGSLILSEDLGRQCFFGYEDASAEELRDMVRLFRIRAVEATAQQQKVLDSTAERVSLAQKCIQELHEAEMAEAERADGLEEELASSQWQLRQVEDKTEIEVQNQCAKFDNALSQLHCAEQRCARVEALLAESRVLAEKRHSDSEEMGAQLIDTRERLASQADAIAMAEAHEVASCRAQEELAVALNELEAERRSKLEVAGSKTECVDRSGFYARYFRDAGWPSLRHSGQTALSSDLAPSELEFALSSVEWNTGCARSCEFRPKEFALNSVEWSTDRSCKEPDVYDSCCDWTIGLDSTPDCSNKENDIRENSLDYSKVSETSLGALIERESSEIATKGHLPKLGTVLCVTQDPAAVPNHSQISRAGAFQPPSRIVSASHAATLTVANSNAVGIDDDVTVVGMENDDDCIDVSTKMSKQDQFDILAREGKTKGAGVRYLLGRKNSQASRNSSELAAVDEDPISIDQDFSAEKLPQASESEITTASLSTPGIPADSVLRASAQALGQSSLLLIDHLFDQCLERAGGHLQGAASVRRVLVDIAGTDEEVPPQLDDALCQLGSSLDAEVSRAQFRAIVGSALALRQSQEISRYEATGSIEINSPCTDGADPEAPHGELANSLRQSARLVRLWSSLPSWSLEIGRTSCDVGNVQQSIDGQVSTGLASEHWSAVECGLENLRGAVTSLQQHGCDKFLQDGITLSGIVEEFQEGLSSFVRCFAEESRARLRAAHASTGRLLEQKRRAADDMTAQLEARDIALQQAQDDCASLSSRLRAAEERSAFAERLAADTAASLVKTQEALQKAEASRSEAIRIKSAAEDLTPSLESMPCWQDSSQKSLGCFEDLVSSLRTELDGAEQRREAADAACRDAESRLHALERRYEEDIRSLQTRAANLPSQLSLSSSISQLPLLNSCSGELKGSLPENLLEELKGVAGNSAYEHALRVEETLRSELHEAHEELERHWEQESQRQMQETAVVAKDVAAIELRLGQMHAGTHFEKVSFKRSLRQARYVRLTFDCRRIEWAQHERGPFKVMPVQAILRVDFGDASRAYRCFEFSSRKPSPGRCFSICTPSRSLDLIAPSERDVEVWVLGLNEITPYRLERQRFTEEEFLLRRAILRLESDYATREVDCDSNGTSSVGGTVYTGDSESARANGSLRNAMSSRLGLRLRR